MNKNNDQKIIEELKEDFPDLSQLLNHSKSEAVGEDFYGLTESANIDVSELIKEKINSVIKRLSINDNENDEINKIFVLMSEEVLTALGEAYEELLVDKQHILVSSMLTPGQIKVLFMTQDAILYHDHETKVQTPPSTEKSIKITNGIKASTIKELEEGTYNFCGEKAVTWELREIVRFYNIKVDKDLDHMSKSEIINAIKKHFNLKGAKDF